MRESKRRRARASSGLKEHLFLNSHLSKFGRAVVAIWPDNGPKVLAERANISIRNVNQIMRGDRRVTARLLHIVNDAMLD